MIRDLFAYGKALVRHWAALVSGAVITVILGVVPGVEGWEVPPWPWKVALGATLFWASFLAWREQSQRVKALTKKATLRVKLNEWVRDGTTYHRVEVENMGPGAVDNVQVALVAIDPHPRDPMARCAYPYRLPNSSGDVTGWTVNEGEAENFLLATSWKSSDGRRIVEGIDGKEEMSPGSFRGWRISMLDDEIWTVRLRVSGSSVGSQEVQVFAYPEADFQIRMSLVPK